MKRTLLLFSAILLFGCKKSDTTTTPITIVGKWIENKSTVQSPGGPVQVTSYTDPNNYIQFNSDGTGILSAGNNGSYIQTNFTYSVTGTTLTLSTYPNLPVTITQLTAHNLATHVDQVQNESGDTYEYLIDDFYSR
jgi:hypothetical protein